MTNSSLFISRLPSVSDIWSVLSTVDSALLGCYLSGANGRRIRGALSALLRSAPLSKSAISRIVGRLLVAVGVKADGQKGVLDLELLGSESSECWGGFVEGLINRGLGRPRLVIIDGNKGLRAAVDKN